MFDKKEVNLYKDMRKRFEDYINFLNNDFFKRNHNCQELNIVGNISRFSFLVLDNERTPLVLVDLLAKKIIVFKTNEYVKNKCLDIDKLIFRNIKLEYIKKYNSIFMRKKKQKVLKESLEIIDEYEKDSKERIIMNNTNVDNIADLISFSLQEEFGTEIAKSIKLKTLYIRDSDFSLSDIFFEQEDGLPEIYNVLSKLLIYKFSTLTEGDYID